MERQLEQTQATVASLRSMLEHQAQPIIVEYRTTPAARALAIRDRISMADAEQWWGSAFDELHAALAATGAQRAGPDGALYSSEFFQADAGEVTAFIPVAGTPCPAGQAVPVELAATELAVTVHHGPFSDLDKTYGALGTFVAERAIGVDGAGRPGLMFNQVPEGKIAKNRVHLDLLATALDEEVDRALAAGAGKVGDFDDSGTRGSP